MKLFAASLCVLFASVESGAQDTTERDASEMHEYFTYHLNAQECLAHKDYHRMNANGTFEQYRVNLGEICDQRTDLSQCLDKVTSDVNALGERFRTEFRLFRAFKELGVEVACGENRGEDLARILVALQREEFSFFGGCQRNATGSIGQPPLDDPNAYMIVEYKVLQKTKECLDEHKGRDDNTEMDLIMSITAQMLDRMKCDRDGNDVLCKTIVDSYTNV